MTLLSAGPVESTDSSAVTACELRFGAVVLVHDIVWAPGATMRSTLMPSESVPPAADESAWTWYVWPAPAFQVPMVAIVSPGAIVSTSIWFGHVVVNAVEVRPGPWLVVAVEIAEAFCQTLVKVSAPPTMPSSAARRS